MCPLRRVLATEHGLVFAVEQPGERTLDVLVDGRRVWSFREPGSPAPPELVPPGLQDEHLRFEPWPAVLRSRLTGTFRVELRAVGGSDTVGATAVRGDPRARPELTDIHGRPLVVNKWRRLGHTLADARPGVVDRMLDSMDGIRDLLQDRLGPVVFVTGGTLLGPVRDGGRLIPHDDDADLAYLSSLSSPADVALEQFEIGRLLRERGYEPIRLTAGHVQVHVSHDGRPDHYVDVFAGWLLDGWWYQHFAIRRRAGAEVVLPPGTVVVEGREEPAPREPEVMLEELFGPGWRVPDPAFRFTLPRATADRFAHWFGDYHAERESWEDLVLLSTGPLLPEEDRPSAYAEEVDRVTPADHAVLELGCGLGTDARALAARGRRVHAVDFSRPALQAARSRTVPGPGSVTFAPVNLLDLRATIRLGARCAAEDRAWTVYGRRLLNALDPVPRANVFRLCAMLLRRGGAAHLDLVDPAYPGLPQHLRLTLDQLVGEAARAGLVLEQADRRTEPLTWIGAPAEEVGAAPEQLVELTRMTLGRRPR